jgi:hypothetical protein
MANDMRGIDRPPARAGGSGVRTTALAALMMPLLTIGLQPLAAQPAKVCGGALSASPLRPVAKPLVVALDHPIDSVANPGLAKAFLDESHRDHDSPRESDTSDQKRRIALL